jgi:hypothetical protein
VRQGRRTTEARCKERKRQIRLDQPEKPAVAEHSIKTGHRIDFSGTSLLGRISGYMDRLLGEALVIRLNRDSFKRQWLHIKPSLVSSNQHFNKLRSRTK